MNHRSKWLNHHTPRLTAGTTSLVLALILPFSGAWAEYKLSAGDTLEISAAGIPELRQRIQINVDGEISLPLLGRMRVAGLPLSEVNAKVQALLPAKELRRRTDDGREYPIILSPQEINVVVGEYQPIYLNGDVSKPGEQPYRPGMIVRQAVALAGGYDVARFRMNNPYMEQADLRSEYQTLWAEYAKEQAHVARLRAELNAKPEPGQQGQLNAPIPKALATEIQNVETEQLRLRLDDLEKERAYLERGVKQEDTRIAVLSEQQRKEREGTQIDTEDLRRLQDLYQKGNLPVMRVLDAKRAILLSSTRELQTAVQVAQVERERAAISRKLQQIDDQRRMDVLRELQEANVKLAGIRSRLEATGEKLVYTGLVRSQLVRGKGSRPELIVYRKNDKGRDRLVVEEDAELQPGDVVEIALQADLSPRTPTE